MKRLCIFVFVAASLFAQQPLKFEVASVKVRPVDSLISMVGGWPAGSRLTLEAMSLSDLVSWAYSVKPWQVASGPQWAGVEKDRTQLANARRFDIVAKAEGDAPSIEEFRRMLQSLLTDRFHLAIHRESRESRVYALVVDKKGARLVESSPEAKGILRMNGGGKITGSGATVTQLVNWFSNANGVDRPIIDQTGLTGRYDFTLQWTALRAGEATDTTAPDIFSALTQQLGLKLVPQNAPLEFLVIDKAEMPTEN